MIVNTALQATSAASRPTRRHVLVWRWTGALFSAIVKQPVDSRTGIEEIQGVYVNKTPLYSPF